jgi:hypothetical protein
LREGGYVDGQNVHIEYRCGGGSLGPTPRISQRSHQQKS